MGSGSSASAGTPSKREIVKMSMGEQLFYYHPDHLGSTGYVTRENGKLHEHIQYFPFGETWVQQGGNTEKSPYLFTSKELDEETGLYYFGARYYDPKTSVWASADPILERYLPVGGQRPIVGGVYVSSNLPLYSYSRNSPVVLKDPDGRVAPIVWGIGVGLGLFVSDIKPANAPGPNDVPTSDSMSLAPSDLAVAAVKSVAPESTHTAIDVASMVGNPKKAIQGAGDLVLNVSKDTSRAARREAMRQEGIPTSQQPVSQSKNKSGREYQYEVPKEGGGTDIKSVQQQTMDRSHPGENHWEAGSVKTDPRTGDIRMNQHGRPQLTNDKSKVDY